MTWALLMLACAPPSVDIIVRPDREPLRGRDVVVNSDYFIFITGEGGFGRSVVGLSRREADFCPRIAVAGTSDVFIYAFEDTACTNLGEPLQVSADWQIPLAVGDVDGDGAEDLLYAESWQSADVWVSALEERVAVVESAFVPRRMVAFDVEGDGTDEVAVAGYDTTGGGGAVRIYRYADDVFVHEATIEGGDAFGEDIGVGDFDGDGRQDLAISDAFGVDVDEQVIVYAFASVAEPIAITSVSSTNSYGFGGAVRLCDLVGSADGGDGLDDLVVVDEAAGVAMVYDAATPSDLPALDLQIGEAEDAFDTQTRIECFDLDADGHEDLVIGTRLSAFQDQLVVLPGPELAFDDAQVLPEAAWGFDSFGTSFALLDDVGGDCAPELLVGIPEYGTNTGKVWVYSGVPVDADADGYSPGTFDYGWWYSSACGDCADTDPNIHPNAVEDCGGFDLDCDGQTDEGADGAVEHWYDGDADGHGDAELDWSAWYCDTPDHFATSNDDCDDANAGVYPGAPELCDDVDQDCDDVSDEDAIDAHTYYADVDGDGFGDPNATVAGCEDPEGYVTDNTDCDDADPDVNVSCADGDPAIELLGLSGSGCACGTSGSGSVAAAPLALARRRRRR